MVPVNAYANQQAPQQVANVPYNPQSMAGAMQAQRDEMGNGHGAIHGYSEGIEGQQNLQVAQTSTLEGP